MKYHVTFQQMGKSGRPIDHPSASDYDTDDKGFAMIPNVGDYVIIEPMMNEGAPRYQGRVKSRLFTYFADQTCGINIVVEESEADDWGAVIKE